MEVNNKKRGLPKFVSRVDHNFVRTAATREYIAERKASALKARYERAQRKSKR